MKKKLFCAALAAVMMAACSSSSDTTTNESATDTTAETTSGAVTEKATVTGDDDSETTAEITKEDGKITSISIDTVTSDGVDKKDTENYGDMSSMSSIEKSWADQVEFLENYIVENGVDSVKLDSSGYAESEDVLAGCTINLTEIMKAVDEANAKFE